MADTSTIWVCLSCYFTDQTGEEQEPESDGSVPWSQWTGLPPVVGNLTVGLMRSEHADGCDPDDECECEHDTFSWQACDGCGSTLGGGREAYTYWE